MYVEPRAEIGIIIDGLLNYRRRLENGQIWDCKDAATDIKNMLNVFFIKCVGPIVAEHAHGHLPDEYAEDGSTYMHRLAHALRDAVDRTQKDPAVRWEDKSPLDDFKAFDDPQRPIGQKDITEMRDAAEAIVDHTLRPDAAMSAWLMLSKARWYAINGPAEYVPKYAQKSLEYCNDVIKREPANVLMCINRAEVLNMLHMPGEIRSMIQKAEETKPDDPDVYHMSLMLHTMYGESKDVTRLLKHRNAASLSEEDCVEITEMLDYRGISEEGLACTSGFIGMYPETPDLRFAEIHILMGLNRYDEAAYRLKDLTELDPSYDTGSAGAIISHRQKRHGEALERIKAAIQEEPNNMALRCSMAIILYETGRTDEALECVNYVLKRDAEDRQGQILKLYMLNVLDRHDDEIGCRPDAIQTDSRGTKRDADGRPGSEKENAGRPVTGILGMYQENMNLSMNTGRRGLGASMDVIMRELDEDIQSRPDAGAPRYVKGLLLFIDKKYEEALPHITRAVDLESDNYDYTILRGHVLSHLGMYEEAIGCFNRAIKIGSKNLQAHHYKGMVLMDLKRFDAAAKCFGTEVRIDPDDVDALTFMCKALLYAKKYKDALGYVRMAISKDQQNVDLHCMHGDILHAMGKNRKALACYQRAVDLEPDNSNMYCALGDIQEQLGRINDALESINTAIRLQPDDSDLYIIRASQLNSLGLYTEALADILEAEEIGDLYPAYLASKGSILENLGRYDEAERCFTELKSIYPDGLPIPE